MGGYDQAFTEKRLNLVTLVISAAFGLIAAVLFANNLWFQLLQFINSTDFNIADPIFGYDVSFYIFRLDFLATVNRLLIFILLGFVAANFLYYFVLLSLRKPDFLTDLRLPMKSPNGKIPWKVFLASFSTWVVLSAAVTLIRTP